MATKTAQSRYRKASTNTSAWPYPTGLTTMDDTAWARLWQN
jgi:hypothetical protein